MHFPSFQYGMLIKIPQRKSNKIEYVTTCTFQNGIQNLECMDLCSKYYIKYLHYRTKSAFKLRKTAPLNWIVMVQCAVIFLLKSRTLP